MIDSILDPTDDFTVQTALPRTLLGALQEPSRPKSREKKSDAISESFRPVLAKFWKKARKSAVTDKFDVFFVFALEIRSGSLGSSRTEESGR